jgi:methionyl-tRNA formyltransferase
MNNKYQIGITIHNFENEQTLLLLKTLISEQINIDFIVYHQNNFKRKILRILKRLFFRDSKEKLELLKKIKNITTYNIKDINSKAFNKVIINHEQSLIICNTGIIKQKLIKNNPNTILINVHESKLPEYRGVSNVSWALWDKKDIYVTIHRINNGIDEGDILYQELLIKYDENIKQSLSQLHFLTKLALCKAIKKFQNGEISFKQQIHIGDLSKRYYSMHPILQNILNKRIK